MSEHEEQDTKDIYDQFLEVGEALSEVVGRDASFYWSLRFLRYVMNEQRRHEMNTGSQSHEKGVQQINMEAFKLMLRRLGPECGFNAQQKMTQTTSASA